MRDNQGWHEEGLSHEQLVRGLQQYITHMQKIDQDEQRHLPPEKQNLLSPAAIIRRKLDWESGTIDPAKGESYSTLRMHGMHSPTANMNLANRLRIWLDQRFLTIIKSKSP